MPGICGMYLILRGQNNKILMISLSLQLPDESFSGTGGFVLKYSCDEKDWCGYICAVDAMGIDAG